MSGLFKSKTSSASYDTKYDPFAAVRGQTSDWLSSQIGKTAPAYTGEIAAGMSEPEKQSLSFLNKYTTQGTPETTNLARNEIKKTLSGDYDPTTSPYYQAVKAESARNLDDTLEGISSDAAGAGRYWTGARLNQQGNARTDTGIGLNKLLGEMSENERVRRLQAVPYAQALGEEEANQPLKQAEALQNIGALPREVAQNLDTATYNEWLRQQNYQKDIADMAQGYATYAPTIAKQTTSPSTFEQLLPYLGGAASTLLNPLLSAAGSSILGGLKGSGGVLPKIF